MPYAPGQSGNPAGRRKGAINKLTLTNRAQIMSGASPIEFLQKVMSGEPIEHGGGLVVPSIDQRVRAATTLANKLVPDAKDWPVSLRLSNDPRDTVQDVLLKMVTGEMTPIEAGFTLSVLGQYSRVSEELDALERPAPARLRDNADAAH